MDHRYIDERSVAQRYLDHSLPAAERADFEAHLVDCPECTDRLLLAEMFHARNGAAKPGPVETPVGKIGAAEMPADKTSRKIRFVGSFSPWLFWILTAAGALLGLAAASLLAWMLLR